MPNPAPSTLDSRDSDLFTELVSSSAALTSEWWAGTFYEAVRIIDVIEGDRVRPVDWATTSTVLEVQALDADHVQLLWSCDPGQPWPPAPNTVFHRNELVHVAR